jgi:hypothetical protein
MEAHIETVLSRLEYVTPAVNELPNELPSESVSELPSELPTVDNYVPAPRTHADDVAFATAMGLTYDDVFGEDLKPHPKSQNLLPNPHICHSPQSLP